MNKSILTNISVATFVVLELALIWLYSGIEPLRNIVQQYSTDSTISMSVITEDIGATIGVSVSLINNRDTAIISFEKWITIFVPFELTILGAVGFVNGQQLPALVEIEDDDIYPGNHTARVVVIDGNDAEISRDATNDTIEDDIQPGESFLVKIILSADSPGLRTISNIHWVLGSDIEAQFGYSIEAIPLDFRCVTFTPEITGFDIVYYDYKQSFNLSLEGEL